MAAAVNERRFAVDDPKTGELTWATELNYDELGPEIVLMLEDQITHTVNRDYARAVAKRSQLPVVTAINRRMASQVVGAVRPRVVVLDIGLGRDLQGGVTWLYEGENQFGPEDFIYPWTQSDLNASPEITNKLLEHRAVRAIMSKDHPADFLVDRVLADAGYDGKIPAEILVMGVRNYRYLRCLAPAWDPSTYFELDTEATEFTFDIPTHEFWSRLSDGPTLRTLSLRGRVDPNAQYVEDLRPWASGIESSIGEVPAADSDDHPDLPHESVGAQLEAIFWDEEREIEDD